MPRLAGPARAGRLLVVVRSGWRGFVNRIARRRLLLHGLAQRRMAGVTVMVFVAAEPGPRPMLVLLMVVPLVDGLTVGGAPVRRCRTEAPIPRLTLELSSASTGKLLRSSPTRQARRCPTLQRLSAS